MKEIQESVERMSDKDRAAFFQCIGIALKFHERYAAKCNCPIVREAGAMRAILERNGLVIEQYPVKQQTPLPHRPT